ncbi:hypothetical protein GGS26DRAFT_540551 [Hypomontagnella submonticulosa]|nr:hypothetical protein GGS26DRAFT_540551 [Hypomontagnella submonticulosa]
MSSRALCGGARASRGCPSLTSRSNLGAGSPHFDLTTAPTLCMMTIPSVRRKYLHTTPMECKNTAPCEVRCSLRNHRSGRSFPRLDSISTGASRVTLWSISACRRSFSRTHSYLREKNETKSKDQTTSQPPRSESAHTAEPRGIRKVIPKVIPSLTPHENIYTVPNLLTFSRLIAAPFIGYAILHDAHGWALGLFAYAGVSDLLDGWIARRWKLQTVVGSVVDPMADKMLMTVLTVCLACQGALPTWLAVVILGRDVGLGIAAIYYRWISLPPPKTFTRYWDFSLPSAEVRPTTISKYNTFLQLGLMGATMVTPLITVDVGMAMTAFQYLVATTTVWSGLSYVFSKDAVRILSENKDKPKRQ